MGTEITAALGRARLSIMLAAVTYLSAVLIGAGLATAGNPTALAQRDAIVAGAQTGSVLTAMNRGDLTRAALLDFGSNLFLGAMPTTLAGLGVVFPFPIAAYRGWVGGIVSVDGRHVSRLVDPASALYYLVTMLLQLTGYVLSMAAGLHVGLALWRHRTRWRVPTAELRDLAWIYALVVTAFLLGSLWEFLV